MRAGKAIRDERALAHAADKPCGDCGHRVGGHRELKPHVTVTFPDGGGPVLVETPHPDYKPLHFHCGEEGCDCVVVAAAS